MSDLIEALLKKDEGIDLDFKEKLEINTKEQKAELSKDVSSIANSVVKQGYLVIVEGVVNINFTLILTLPSRHESIPMSCYSAPYKKYKKSV